MVVLLLLGKYRSMRIFLLTLLISSPNFAIDSFSIPKETYLTFDQYLLSKKETSGIKAPSDWIQLSFSSPLIGKFQVNDRTILSVSAFDGSIGNELSNLNRWRAQLGLDQLESVGDSFQTYTLNSSQIRSVTLTNTQQYFVIYWITVGDRHIFNKFVSTGPVSKDLMDAFIESQSWSSI